MDLGLGLLNTLKPHHAINWLEDALTKYRTIINNTIFMIILCILNHIIIFDF